MGLYDSRLQKDVAADKEFFVSLIRGWRSRQAAN